MINLKTINNYIRLTKPVVSAGNVLSAVAGFLFAAAVARQFDLGLLIALTVGTSFVIAAACVINNFLDRDIDAVMQRTKGRPSVLGDVSAAGMVIFGVSLVLVGSAILLIFTNLLTTLIGLAGFVVYVWLYGAWSKRKSIHGTFVGAISGALPIAGGYAAVTNRIDLAMLILSLVMIVWQFMEFYSIAIYLRSQYKAAQVPVMTVVRGVPYTVKLIVISTIGYVALTLSLTPLGYTGLTYFVVMALGGLYVICLAVQGPSASQPEAWARAMFKAGMRSLLLLSLMLAIGPILI